MSFYLLSSIASYVPLVSGLYLNSYFRAWICNYNKHNSTSEVLLMKAKMLFAITVRQLYGWLRHLDELSNFHSLVVSVIDSHQYESEV